jgi:hypothetical protein
MTKIFISYSSKNQALLNHLRTLFEQNKKFALTIVPEQNMNLTPSSEKVKKGLDSSNIFVAILTEEALNTQWVNQEIGYWYAKHNQPRKMYFLVEKKAMPKLNGFISRDMDMPYRFSSEDSFKVALEKLHKDLVKNHSYSGIYHIR